MQHVGLSLVQVINNIYLHAIAWGVQSIKADCHLADKMSCFILNAPSLACILAILCCILASFRAKFLSASDDLAASTCGVDPSLGMPSSGGTG